MRSRALAALTIGAACAAAWPARAQTIDTLALRAHTYHLAHDLLEGRGTGTRGERLAAVYIAGQLRRLGIAGAGPDGSYFLPFPYGAAGPATFPANIAALLPGRDPALRHEVVALTAHYDHLGIGKPDARGDSVYNGFSDDAAGVAMVLAIADVMRQRPPARSVLFLFFTGEELGLLGSTHYVAAPAVPLERTVAVVNLDAGAPPAPPRSWQIAGGAESPLGEVAADIARRRGWAVILTRARPISDFWPFHQRGVPTVFPIPGRDWEGITPEQRARLEARWERYHLPSDEWAEDFPFQGLLRYAEFAEAIARAAADAPPTPR